MPPIRLSASRKLGESSASESRLPTSLFLVIECLERYLGLGWSTSLVRLFSNDQAAIHTQHELFKLIWTLNREWTPASWAGLDQTKGGHHVSWSHRSAWTNCQRYCNFFTTSYYDDQTWGFSCWSLDMVLMVAMSWFTRGAAAARRGFLVLSPLNNTQRK